MKKKLPGLLILLSLAYLGFLPRASAQDSCYNFALDFQNIDSSGIFPIDTTKSQFVTLPPNTANSGNFISGLTGDYTVEVNFFWRGAGDSAQASFQRLFDLNGNGSQNLFFLAVNQSAGYGTFPRFVISNTGTTSPSILDGTDTVSSYVWHHIAITFDSAHATDTMYLDGTKIGAQTSVLSASLLTSISEAYLGKSTLSVSDSFFNGKMDEFRVSNIRRYHGTTFNDNALVFPFTKDAHTIALYHMDDSLGSEFLPDSSGNGYTAILGSDSTETAHDPIKDSLCINTVATPVRFISFTGQEFKGAAQLQWATPFETDNSYFEVQRSTDGQTFRLAGTVQASNQYAAVQDYIYTDLQASQGLNYYRLKQVDQNGAFAYSDIIRVYIGKSGALKLYPTLTTGTLNLVMPKPGQVVILNMMGIEVEHLNITGSSQQLDVSGLPGGQYILQVVGTRQTRTFIKE